MGGTHIKLSRLEGKKKKTPFVVTLKFVLLLTSSVLKRQSMTLSRSVAGSMGSYLPDVLTEMWEPARDFAFLRLPSAGVQSVVALSK